MRNQMPPNSTGNAVALAARWNAPRAPGTVGNRRIQSVWHRPEDKFVNLTPHAIQIVGLAAIPSSGVARCEVTSTLFGGHGGAVLIRAAYGAVVGLPDPVDGVMYIVSALVRAAVPARDDVASPGDLVRDSDGNITGCKNLVVN